VESDFAVAAAAKHSPRRILDGTARVFLAEALIMPTGLATVAYLTRRLGPSEYGRYTLAVALITWLEWGFSAPLARAAVRVVGAASDWRPLATLVLRVQLMMGAITAVALWLGAPFIAAALAEPSLTSLLRLFSLDLPLFALAQGHLQILVALGHFRIRALLPLVRWTVRLALIVLGVEAGLSVYGVVLAIVGTSLTEVMVARRFVSPAIFRRSGVPVRQLFDYALPLLLSGLCLRIFDRVDVVLLKFLGRSVAEVGMYGAAQNLTLATGLFALAFSPVLLSTITEAIRERDMAYARRIATDSLTCVLFLIPFAAILAASSGEIVNLLFGKQYFLSAQAFECLIFAGLANVMISVGSAILIGGGKPSWTLAVAVPMTAVAIIAHTLVIPRFGLFGAALVTAVCATGGALLTLGAVHRLWQVAPPVGSVIKSVVAAAAGLAVAATWSTPGVLVVVKVGGLCLLLLALLIWSGEIALNQVLMGRPDPEGVTPTSRPVDSRG